MTKRIYSAKQIEEITGASHHEDIRVPFYYAPPFLDALREKLVGKLKSCGGRRTILDWDVIRKIRFSDQSWERLKEVSDEWSETGFTVSPAQVASVIVELSLAGFPKTKKSDTSSRKSGRRELVHA